MRRYSVLLSLFFSTSVSAQIADSIPQKDVVDILQSVWKRGDSAHKGTPRSTERRIELSVVPALGLSISTGLSFVLTSNVAFYLGDHKKTNLSSVYTSPTYSLRKQFIIPILANIWTKNNNYNILTNWAFMLYPSPTYGLGTKTTQSDELLMNFNYIRLYQTVFKNLGHNWYAGLGYNWDYFSKTTVKSYPTTRISDAVNYGITATSKSSGVTLNVLYNSRKNPIHPKANEKYALVTYRHNSTRLGSANNWESLLFDFRQYIQVGHTRSILAFWSYDVINLAGNPLYQLLPSTGWDAYNNTGRGYARGRFRGKNMLYLESEYRFPIMRNGLLGGVVFINGQSFSEPVSHQFKAVAVGYGVGIRIKLNKHSDTNWAIDYAFGNDNSRGIFINLGEVF